MFKLAAFISLMLIGNLLAGSLSCDSCGNECASACGTRHFRSCCFNYLRRKRGPEIDKFRNLEMQMDQLQRDLPMFPPEEIPRSGYRILETNDFRPYYLEDTAENRLQRMFDV